MYHPHVVYWDTNAEITLRGTMLTMVLGAKTMLKTLCLWKLLFSPTALKQRCYFGEKKVRSTEGDESIWAGFQEEGLHRLAARTTRRGRCFLRGKVQLQDLRLLLEPRPAWGKPALKDRHPSARSRVPAFHWVHVFPSSKGKTELSTSF